MSVTLHISESFYMLSFKAWQVQVIDVLPIIIISLEIGVGFHYIELRKQYNLLPMFLWYPRHYRYATDILFWVIRKLRN